MSKYQKAAEAAISAAKTREACEAVRQRIRESKLLVDYEVKELEEKLLMREATMWFVLL